MRRRTFLKHSAAFGTAAIATASAPLLLGATDKAGSKLPVIGEGQYRYECHHGWGELPKNLHWETTHGVTIDRAGFIYIKQLGDEKSKNAMDTIVVFDPQGKYVRSFAKDIYPGGHGIDLRVEGGEEFLYLCDIHHRQVIKTNLKGDVVWKLDYPKEPGVYKNAQGYRPTNVAFAPDCGFYVGDGYGSSYIHQYDKDAKWVRTWGGLGKEHGKFSTPHGLWWDDRPGRDPSLVIADRANARLEYYTAEGKYLSTISDVLFPAHFDIRGDVLLVPDLHARVSLFGRDNKVIVHLGYDKAWTEEVKKFKIRGNPKTWVPGKFIHPHDACFDHEGNIFVVEWVPAGRVTLLKKVS